MKTVIYHEGPDRVTAGIAGELRRGIPKELPDEVAEVLCGDPMYQILEKNEIKEENTNVTSSRK